MHVGIKHNFRTDSAEIKGYKLREGLSNAILDISVFDMFTLQLNCESHQNGHKLRYLTAPHVWDACAEDFLLKCPRTVQAQAHAQCCPEGSSRVTATAQHTDPKQI